jgi:hypothetical protein
MAINSTSDIPSFCTTCQHRFVCDIQEEIRNLDRVITDFNKANSSIKISVSSTNYICGYKLKTI